MLSAHKITQIFNGRTILKDFTYIFEQNNIYAIMGESGCGKSTLLRILCGLLLPSSGDVLYNNKKIHKTNSDIFMMSQGYTNFPWKTSIENVVFPLKIKGIKIDSNIISHAKDILASVGLEECIDKFPVEMSGGQRQRLALARIIIAKPSVILMDEPMSALDKNTRTLLQDVVMKFRKDTQCCIIMITHDKEEALRMCTKTIINLKVYKEN